MKRSLPTAACLLLAGATSCLNPVEHRIQPDAPVELHPLSRPLAGRPLGDVLVGADRTLATVDFDSGLLRRVAQRASPAVVSIFTKTSSTYTVNLLPVQPPWGGPRIRVRGQALGSGFFVHPSGYILTNEHVVREAREIRVMALDGADLGVDVVAIDPAYDLALLRVLGPARNDYPVLPMGDSEALGVGEWVIAVGNPLGLGHSVTIGIVSQVGRNLSGISDDQGRPVRFIQIDAAINPGSSGGPLVTLTGAWVGVNSAGIPNAQNIGFSVPSSQVREFVERVLRGEGRRVER